MLIVKHENSNSLKQFVFVREFSNKLYINNIVRVFFLPGQLYVYVCSPKKECCKTSAQVVVHASWL